MVIYIVVVIEDYYEKVVVANPDLWFKLTFGTFTILLFGLVIFLLVSISPQLRRLLFRTFGAEEDRGDVMLETQRKATSESSNLTDEPKSSENDNKVREIKPAEFEKGKGSLLRYYSDIQTSLVTRLIGFVAGLFILVQTVQTSEIYPIVNVFPIQPLISITINEPYLSIVSFLRLLIFAAAILVLTYFIVRTIFRFTAFNMIREAVLMQKFTSNLLEEILKEIPEKMRKNITPNTGIQEIITIRVLLDLKKAEPKVKVWHVPITWFIQSESLLEKDNKCGSRLIFFLSAVLTILFIWILR